MWKFSSFLLWISILALSSISCTFAYTHEQREAYQWAYKYSITTQPDIEAANLDWNITRQAFSKMVINYLENVVWLNQTPSNLCIFSDEDSIIKTLIPYAKKTCAYEIMWSDGKDFKPMNYVSRAQLWTALSRILWWDEYNLDEEWYYIYHFNALRQSGIMKNINNPQAYAKRWDVLVMLKRMYEKFGSGVNMNGNKVSIYNETGNLINSGYTESIIVVSGNVIDTTTVSGNTIVNSGNTNLEEDKNDYISTIYENSEVIYTGKDWTKYYYDNKFLSALKATAEKKWESDLAKYLEAEVDYFEKWLDQLKSLDLDNLPKILWIDEDDIDLQSMTPQEKEEFIKTFKEWVDKLTKETKYRNNQYISNLENIIKTIETDKFWLEDKYKETKSFIDTSNTFLDVYSEIIFKLVELAANSKDWKIDDSEAVGVVFSLMWSAITYQDVAEKYETYIEKWAMYTIKILGWELVN